VLMEDEFPLTADVVVVNDQLFDLEVEWLERILDVARAVLKASELGNLLCMKPRSDTPADFFDRFHNRRLHELKCERYLIFAPAEVSSQDWQAEHMESPHPPIQGVPGRAIPLPDWGQELYYTADFLPWIANHTDSQPTLSVAKFSGFRG